MIRICDSGANFKQANSSAAMTSLAFLRSTETRLESVLRVMGLTSSCDEARQLERANSLSILVGKGDVFEDYSR